MSMRTMLLAAGLAALLPMSAMAQGPAGGHGWHHGRHGGGDLSFLAGVQLTDAQKGQVHQLLHASFQQIGPLEKQIRSLHQQISNQLASTATIDQAQLSSLQAQADQLRGQVDEQRLATALQIRALLTPDQLAQAASVHQQLQSLDQQIRSVLGQGAGGASAN